MNPNDPNIQAMQLVARALGPILDQFVFVGGCAAGLLITDNARPPVRATQDVDLLVEVVSKAEHYAIAEKLHQLGFRQTAQDDIICRWRVDSLQVDLLPTEEGVLGFSNRWYRNAAQNSVAVTLPAGMQIRLVSGPYFLATKLDAFSDRGNGNYGQSHDIEDIVNVVDGRPGLPNEIIDSDDVLREFLKDEIDALLGTPEFTDTLAWHLPTDAASQARIPIILDRFRAIAGI